MFFLKCPCLCPSLSVFLILHGSSPVIHPGQATIPYKAGGIPHLASYFHIRSAVRDKVYTGSSLECEAASLSAVPTNLTVLSAQTPVTPPPFSPLFAVLRLLSPPFSHTSPYSSSHLALLYTSSFPPFPDLSAERTRLLAASELSIQSRWGQKRSVLRWSLALSSQYIQRCSQTKD